MKDIFKNIPKEKVTTGTGIAILLLIAARLLGLKVDEVAGIPINTLAQYLGEAVVAIILMFARDPKNNNNIQKKQ